MCDSVSEASDGVTVWGCECVTVRVCDGVSV